MDFMKINNYLEASPVFALNFAYEKIVSKINRDLHAEGLNLLQGLLLTTLFFEEDRNILPSELADLLKTTRANISHIISHLECRGFLKRAVNPQDARQFHIQLKSEGRKKALSLIKFFDTIQAEFERKLGVQNCEKLNRLIRQLEKE
jgi:DNA-binding MarR family transcriptional regulator